jgi:spore coat polysaccharide biosynthesis protein SpsF
MKATSMPRTVIITQVRMTSTRLPGKVLKTIYGRTLLEWHLERLKSCAPASEVVVATTVNAADDAIVPIARKMDLRCFRGSEDDVLSRFWGAAREARAEMVVRVTSDCPLWDPVEGAKVVDLLAKNPQADLASNFEPRTYPRGLDTETLWIDVLERMQRAAPPAPSPLREHVTEMAYGNQAHLFVKKSFQDFEDNSRFRWCVDTPDDFAAIEALAACAGNPLAGYRELLACAKAHPEISAMNNHVEQKKV